MTKEYTRAVAVLCAVVVAGTLFGSHRSLASERKTVENLASTQQNGGCLLSDLLSAGDTAANLATLGEKYFPGDEEVSALKATVAELRAADNLTDGSAALETLSTQTYALTERLRQAELSEKDASAVEGLYTDLLAAFHRMSYDDYNAHAVAFNENLLGKFPANLLGGLTGIKNLPVFEEIQLPH